MWAQTLYGATWARANTPQVGIGVKSFWKEGLNFEIFVSGDDLAEWSDVKNVSLGFKRPCKLVKFRYFKRFFFLNIKHGFPWIGVAVGVTYEGYIGWWMVFTWEILVSSDMCFAVPLMPVRPGDTYLPTAWFISRCPGVGFGLKLLPCVLDSCQSFTVFFLLLFWRKVEVMASNFGSQVVVQVGVIISKTRLKGYAFGSGFEISTLATLQPCLATRLRLPVVDHDNPKKFQWTYKESHDLFSCSTWQASEFLVVAKSVTNARVGISMLWCLQRISLKQWIPSTEKNPAPVMKALPLFTRLQTRQVLQGLFYWLTLIDGILGSRPTGVVAHTLKRLLAFRHWTCKLDPLWKKRLAKPIIFIFLDQHNQRLVLVFFSFLHGSRGFFLSFRIYRKCSNKL